MKNNYLLEYSDTFSLNEKIKEITNDKITNYAYTTYDLEEHTLDTILEDLDTISFLDEGKIIIVKHIELLSSDDKTTNKLLKYLENSVEANILILTSNKLDNRKKITKDLKNKMKYIKLETNPMDIIKRLLKNYKYSNDIINLIIDYTNSNIDAIYKECEKIVTYQSEKKEIKIDEIKKIVYKHKTDENQILFDLIKYISLKDKKNSMIKYKILKEQHIDDMAIIGLLESQLRLMFQTALLKEDKLSKNEIAKYLDIHPFRIEKTLELLSSTPKNEVRKLIQDLAELDYKIKSGKLSSKDFFEMFIINL